MSAEKIFFFQWENHKFIFLGSGVGTKNGPLNETSFLSVQLELQEHRSDDSGVEERASVSCATGTYDVRSATLPSIRTTRTHNSASGSTATVAKAIISNCRNAAAALEPLPTARISAHPTRSSTSLT